MSTTVVHTPTSRCLVGVAQADITPPVSIYHRMWGAAKHDRATGVHRPLRATALVLEPAGEDAAQRHVFVAVDHCMLRPDDMGVVLAETSRLSGIDVARITFSFAHTHSGGHIVRSRADLPGGELIGPYLDELPARVSATITQAVETRRLAVLTYANAVCDMARNRDYYDEPRGLYVCGFNPDACARNGAGADVRGYPLHVVRVTDAERGDVLATVVNYPCHPTTLAWDNTLISPDYVGALRETVEAATGATCVFLLAPSGDVGPRHGYVGDPNVADQNGRQVGYAALAAIESMPPPGADQHYVGPVISGATIGVWEHRPLDPPRWTHAEIFRSRLWDVPLGYRDDLPTLDAAQAELDRRLADESQATARGDDALALRLRALVERQRRLIERVRPLPVGDRYPYRAGVLQAGDAFWILLEGEPYHALQDNLQRRFPRVPLVFAVLANGARSSYLPRREDYAKPLYQVEVSLLAPGSLETLTDEIAAQVERWQWLL